MIRPYQATDCQILALCDPCLNTHQTFIWLNDHKVLGFLVISRVESEIYIHHYVLNETIDPVVGIPRLMEDLQQSFKHEDIYFLHQ